MAETKYGKHLIKAPIQTAKAGPPIPTMYFPPELNGIGVGMILVPVLKPRLFEDPPHKHDFHQFLCFLGSDPNNIGELGAEIEVTLGEEEEKHLVTTPTILHITPGLVHCPIEYKKVDQPVMHLDIFFAPEYERRLEPK